MTIEKKNKFSPVTALEYLFKKPVTVRFPKEELDVFPGVKGVSPNYRGLHTNDLDTCIGCGTCSDICPTDAIRMVELAEPEEGKKTGRPVIDYGRCCFCAFCVDVCTTGSLSMSRDHIHIERTPKVEDPEVEVEKIKEAFIMQPNEDRGDNIGYCTPDELAWLDLDRVKMEELKPETRSDSFIEIVKGFSQEQARLEAERCVECGVCTEACPATMNIPEYIRAIWDDDLKESVRQIYRTNPLPNVCGRVCTHNCETVCAIGHRGEPVAIRWLKRYAVDNLPFEDVKKIAAHEAIKSNNKKVAIIGSGPGGLSAAYYLSLMGYEITVYEKMAKAGGMTRYGIPEYRLPYDRLDKDIETITQLGVKIKTNTEVGKDISLEKLHSDFDAVFASTGLHLGRSTRVDGTDNPMVFQAIDLLRDVTEGKKIEVAEKIVVIGGGNVAMDIARTLARLQNKKYGKVQLTLTSLETEDIMPADVEEITESREENIVIKDGWGPKDIKIEDGKIKGLNVIRCTSVFDKDGRFNPKFDQKDSAFFEADQIVEAIGQGMDIAYMTDKFEDELKMTKRNRIKVDDTNQSSLPWLFVGGDITGGTDAITAIADGHRAAKGIDKYLAGTKKK